MIVYFRIPQAKAERIRRCLLQPSSRETQLAGRLRQVRAAATSQKRSRIERGRTFAQSALLVLRREERTLAQYIAEQCERVCVSLEVDDAKLRALYMLQQQVVLLAFIYACFYCGSYILLVLLLFRQFTRSLIFR
jgi:hypothetical protein